MTRLGTNDGICDGETLLDGGSDDIEVGYVDSTKVGPSELVVEGLDDGIIESNEVGLYDGTITISSGSGMTC